MYAVKCTDVELGTSDRQTDKQMDLSQHCLVPPTVGAEHNNRVFVVCAGALNMCRVNSSKRCQSGLCLPKSLTCDGVEYCPDGSTTHILCRESTAANERLYLPGNYLV